MLWKCYSVAKWHSLDRYSSATTLSSRLMPFVSTKQPRRTESASEAGGTRISRGFLSDRLGDSYENNDESINPSKQLIRSFQRRGVFSGFEIWWKLSCTITRGCTTPIFLRPCFGRFWTFPDSLCIACGAYGAPETNYGETLAFHSRTFDMAYSIPVGKAPANL
jgi:hypothetical protein